LHTIYPFSFVRKNSNYFLQNQVGINLEVGVVIDKMNIHLYTPKGRIQMDPI